jgi:hypothetical protein
MLQSLLFDAQNTNFSSSDGSMGEAKKWSWGTCRSSNSFSNNSWQPWPPAAPWKFPRWIGFNTALNHQKMGTSLDFTTTIMT